MDLIKTLCDAGFDFDTAISISECFTDNGGQYPAMKEAESADVETI